MKTLLFLMGPIWFAGFAVISWPGFAQTVHGSMPSPVRELVLDVLKQSGIASAQMISRRRSTSQEAAFLYRLLHEADDKAAIRQRYGAAGQQVIDVYHAHHMKPRVAVLALMDAEIKKQISLLGEKRREFAYVGPSKFHKFVVVPAMSFDRSRITDRFEAALQDHPDIVQWVGNEGGAYHIEVPKLMRTISGLWRGRCRETLADGETVRYRHVLKLKRSEQGYSGLRKSPPESSGPWVTSRLENLSIDRRTKKIAYSYKGEAGRQIDIVGRFNADYNRITFEHNSSKAKCRLRKRL